MIYETRPSLVGGVDLFQVGVSLRPDSEDLTFRLGGPLFSESLGGDFVTFWIKE